MKKITLFLFSLFCVLSLTVNAQDFTCDDGSTIPSSATTLVMESIDSNIYYNITLYQKVGLIIVVDGSDEVFSSNML